MRNNKEYLKVKVMHKSIALSLVFSIMFQVIFPSVSYAITPGGIQPEYANAMPSGASNLVNLSTGDFNYSINVMTVPASEGAYDIQLTYNSKGINMETPASCVGLGWSIMGESIVRHNNGVFDDAKGDEIKQKIHVKDFKQYSLRLDPKSYREIAGVNLPNLNLDVTQLYLYWNNYKGLGIRLESDFGQYDSQNGLNASYAIPFKGFNFPISYGSRSGYSASIQYSIDNSKNENRSANGYVGGGLGRLYSLPVSKIPMKEVQSTQLYKLGFLAGQTNSGTFSTRSPYTAYPITTIKRSVVNNGDFIKNGYGIYYHDDIPVENDISKDSYYEPIIKDYQNDDIPFERNLPNLSYSKRTSDLFVQTGHGSGGIFKLNRSTVDVVSNPRVLSSVKREKIQAEAGAGAGDFHIGGAYAKEPKSYTISANRDPSIISNFSLFKDYLEYPDHYEYLEQRSYPIKNGEVQVHKFNNNGNTPTETWGGLQAVQNKLKLNYQLKYTSSNQYQYESKFGISSGSVVTEEDKAYKGDSKRKKRDADIRLFTQKDLKLGYSQSNNIKYRRFESAFSYKKFPENSDPVDPNSELNKHNHHFSEISVYDQGGVVNNYGLPVYTKKEVKAVFSINQSLNFNAQSTDVNIPSKNGNVSYAKANESYNGNEILRKTTTKNFVNTWLLTSAQNSEYIDLTGDGLSKDDPGYRVEFEYIKYASNYKSRFPYKGATFIEGVKGDKNDDLGTYEYTEHELFYRDIIKTNSHVAKMYYSNREDGVEAKNELEGGLPSNLNSANKMQKLDRIELYLIEDFNFENNMPNSGASPIQTTFFKYTYELCKNLPNNENGNGKLVLKEVYNTYYSSVKGKLSRYKFNYGEDNDIDNPNYEEHSVDRWGEYKDVSVYKFNGNKYPYADFPYTNQRLDGEYGKSPNQNAQAHVLKSIVSPTGSEIIINWEAKDYAYEEDRKAYEMYDIIGTSQSSINPNTRLSSNDEIVSLPKGEVVDLDEEDFRLYFKLKHEVSPSEVGSNKADFINSRYLKDGLKEIYFKAYMKLRGNAEKSYDYVEGIAEVDRYKSGLHTVNSNNKYDIGYITLKPVELNIRRNFGFKHVHPFIREAMQFLQLNRPDIAYGETNPNSFNPTNLFSFIQDIGNMVLGFNRTALTAGWCQEMQLNGRSIIRLTSPDGKKFGGGRRVKSIEVLDNAKNVSAEGDYKYTTEYDYTTKENGKTISSGVAYEPLNGVEERALFNLTPYEEGNTLFGGFRKYKKEIYALDEYPSGSIVYSKVTVRSKYPIDDNSGNKTIDLSKAPITVYEFYTGKDYKVIYDETNVSKNLPISYGAGYGSYSHTVEHNAKSQGYSITYQNSVHGQLKSITERTAPITNNSLPSADKDGGIISRQSYFYKNNGNGVLKNEVNLINSSNNSLKVIKGKVGENVDVYVDYIQNVAGKRILPGFGIDANLDFIKPFIFVPTAFPNSTLPPSNRATFTKIVVNKRINKMGVLEKVITQKNSSIIETEYLGYDEKTGAPVLSKVENEFHDPIYKYKKLGVWDYKGMSESYNNSGLSIVDYQISCNSNGEISLPTKYGNHAHYFSVGDRVYLELFGGVGEFENLNNVYGNVVQVESNFIKISLEAKTSLQDENGTVLYPENLDGLILTNVDINRIDIVESGYNNLNFLTTGEKVAGVIESNGNVITSLDDIVKKSQYTNFTFSNILNVSAIVYDDLWTVPDHCRGEVSLRSGDNSNLFRRGVMGKYRPWKTFVINANRENSNSSTINYGTRKDGYLSSNVNTSFDLSDLNNLEINNPDWVKASEVISYDPNGNVIEQKDALGLFSSMYFGYGRKLPVAIASNAKRSEIGFDSFEEYGDTNSIECRPIKFHVAKLTGEGIVNSKKYAHTGSNCYLLPALEDSNSSGASIITGFTTLNNFHNGDKDDPLSRIASQQFNIDFNNDGVYNSYNYWIEPSNLHYGEENALSQGLSLESDKEYILTFWLKPQFNSVANNVEVVINNQLVTTNSATNLVEGFERISVKFRASGYDKININNLSDQNYYLDDLSIQPANSSMVKYVYDAKNYRLLAELDDQSFATYYIYDPEGNVRMIKQETKDGLKTITETRSHVIKNALPEGN